MAPFEVNVVSYALGAAGLVFAIWLYCRVRWVQAVNKLPRRAAGRRGRWLGDLAEFWRAPSVPGTSQPDALPLLARWAAQLHKGGHGLGVLWLFNPKLLPFARPLVLVWDPELVREVLEPKNYGNFQKGNFYSVAEPLLGKGLLSAGDGPGWTFQRHLAQQGFGPKVLDDVIPTVKAALDYLFTTWDELASKNELVRVQADMRHLALDVFGKLIFDYEFGALEGPRKAPLCGALDCMLEVFDKMGRASPFLRWLIEGPHFNRALAEVDGLALELLGRAQRGEPAAACLLSHLAWGVQGKEGREPVLGRRLVLENLKTFLLTGHDTVASSLAWALWLLASHSSAQGRLQQEVDKFFEDAEASGEVLGCSAFRKLPFLDAVVKETLRLYPAMAIARAPVKDIELSPTSRSGKPYVVPRGCDLLVLPSLIHRDESQWPQPDSFDPARWLDKGNTRSCTYLPFGFGRRSCVGQEFAMTEIRSVLAYIVRRYQLRCDDAGPEPRPVWCFNISPSPFSLRLERRSRERV